MTEAQKNRSGTTSVNNINAMWSQSVLKAFDELGLRGTLAITLKDHDIKTHENYDCSKLVEENIRLVKSLANHPQLRGMFGIANEITLRMGRYLKNTDAFYVGRRHDLAVFVSTFNSHGEARSTRAAPALSDWTCPHVTQCQDGRTACKQRQTMPWKYTLIEDTRSLMEK